MQCPVCKDKDLVMADRQGIEIDYCPQCRGVWLDRGELDKIIERSATAAAPVVAPSAPQPVPYQQPPQPQQPPPPQHGHYDPRYGYHGKKKRKGFLSDIFDFD